MRGCCYQFITGESSEEVSAGFPPQLSSLFLPVFQCSTAQVSVLLPPMHSPSPAHTHIHFLTFLLTNTKIKHPVFQPTTFSKGYPCCCPSQLVATQWLWPANSQLPLGKVRHCGSAFSVRLQHISDTEQKGKDVGRGV